MSSRRIYFLIVSFVCWSLLIWGRLFYWQVIAGERLAAAEKKQALQIKPLKAPRGEIFAADGQPLVLNSHYYDLYLWKPVLNISPSRLLEILRHQLNFDERKEEEKWWQETKERLEQKSPNWLLLRRELSPKEAKRIESLAIKGLFLEEGEGRFYPESSSSAHLLGFLGLDRRGERRGYFGLEGFYDRQLRGHSRLIMESQGWWNKIRDSFGKKGKVEKGRDLILFLDRTVQFILEEELQKGIKRYGAESGLAVILEPFGGGVLAMAAFPSYDPAAYFRFPAELFPNPVIAKHFEPGSIFKPFVAAAALDAGIIDQQTPCEICHGPVQIGEYQIETWNKKYYPQSNVVEIIQHSDNVGMVWIARKLGLKKLWSYLQKFNFGQRTQIDLEEEAAVPLKPQKEWYPVDLATVSFGQGIAVTPIQIVSAFAAFANGGLWVKPRVVARIKDGQKENATLPFSRRVIKSEVAQQLKEILINAVEKGEAQWTKIPGYTVAGKTGTAQIPVEGRYEEESTIASFVGFAPAEKNQPKFVMLVSLTRPTSSPWGSETAAPLWFAIAKRLFFYWGVIPH